MPALEGIPRFSYGELQVSALNMPTAIETFFQLIDERNGGYVACTCTHGVIEVARDPKLRAIIDDAVLALPDGMPLVWLGRFKGAPVERVTAPDFVEQVLRDPRGRTLRHYFYGGMPDAMEKIVRRVAAQLGPQAIAGWHCPPFRAAGAMEDPAVVAEIKAAKPDVIWVGLGLPKQEYWMANHQAQFPGVLMLGVGAAFLRRHPAPRARGPATARAGMAASPRSQSQEAVAALFRRRAEGAQHPAGRGPGTPAPDATLDALIARRLSRARYRHRSGCNKRYSQPGLSPTKC